MQLRTIKLRPTSQFEVNTIFPGHPVTVPVQEFAPPTKFCIKGHFRKMTSLKEKLEVPLLGLKKD